MQKPSHLSNVLTEYCLLCDLNYFRVISVQRISPCLRIPINHHSAMKRLNRRWLTVSEYCKVFGDLADKAFVDYSPHQTLSNIRTLNSNLSAKYGYPHEA